MNGAGKTSARKVQLECPEHGSYEGIACSFMGQAELMPRCPWCEAEESAAREPIQFPGSQNSLELKWRDMNIGAKFYESSFGNFDAYNDELKRHLDACRKFAANPKGKLVLIGEHGNGKTHLAVSILKETGGAIFKSFEIGLMLRASYNGGDFTEWEIFSRLCTEPLLVIDEIEKTKDSEAKQNWLSYVVGKRYDACLPIVFIGNCHFKSDCAESRKPCPRCLESCLENDILSRIIEDGAIMKFASGDYRREIRKARVGRE